MSDVAASGGWEQPPWAALWSRAAKRSTDPRTLDLGSPRGLRPEPRPGGSWWNPCTSSLQNGEMINSVV